MISVRVIVRRILGRRLTFLLRNCVSSVAYMLGFYEYADKTGRGDCITAMVCSYNESEWIVPSMLSVKSLVDEYVVVDSSTDETPELVRGLAREEGLNVRLIRLRPGSLSAARNRALEAAGCRWILHLDPDLVLYDKGVKVIKSLIEDLDKRRHYLVYWKYLRLCGDLKHVCANHTFHIEHWLFTWSSKLTYKDLKAKGKIYDMLIAPLHLYKTVFIDDVLGVHLVNVRRPERLAVKFLWWRFREEFTRLAEEGYSFEELAARKAREVYGARSLRELGLHIMRDLVRRNPLRDERVYPLPRVLEEFVKRKIEEGDEYYRIVYEGLKD